jgi:hypothetical protein
MINGVRRLLTAAAVAVPLAFGLAALGSPATAATPSGTSPAAVQHTARLAVDSAHTRHVVTAGQPAGTTTDGKPTGPVTNSWRTICSYLRDAGVRHYPGGPAFAQILGGSDVYVDDYRDRVWVHISWPVSGYVLYSSIC